ncbi:MAG: DUF4124 domain-containing protein [Desulfobacteraceae bacterium]|jgi:hypothetical protein|nr:DUF4124 domain-containing protein [Desulfobacteraceae bacterium]
MLGYFKFIIGCSLLLIFAIPAYAEFYQYVDSRGITHFTDKFSTIPATYQSQLQIQYQKNSLPERLPYPEYEDAQLHEKKSRSHRITELKAEKSRLLDQKQMLNQGFEILISKKQRIESNKENMKNKESILTYNKNVKEINKKIQLYKKVENRFILGLKRYNESIAPLTAE